MCTFLPLDTKALVAACVVWLCCVRCGAGLAEHYVPALELWPRPAAPDSLFGYSLLARDGPNPEVAVGAPRAHQSARGTLRQPGALHRCALPALDAGTRAVLCPQLDIDPEGNTEYSNLGQNSFKHYKDGMWLGGSITGATNVNGSLMVCAPRWVNQIHKDDYLMNGMCYALAASDRAADTAILQPLVSKAKQVHSTGDRYEFLAKYAQAGFASHLTADGRTLLLGAPGVHGWTGSVVRYRVTPQPHGPDHFILRNTPNTFYTSRALLPETAYFGYSVTSGAFASDGGLLYAAGAPRADVAAGARSAPSVLVFDFPASDEQSLNVRATLSSPQFGSYFGAALLALDADADGRCDLIVAAPLHAHRTALSVDVGRVYLFLNSPKENGEFVFVLGGEASGQDISRARFGSSLALLGDIDGDGLPEFVAGAPYEGRGAVYVYSARSMRLLQRVAAAASSAPGFGVALARSPDLDRNGCDELAVGSLGGAAVLRCRPALEVRARIQLAGHEKVQFCVDLPPSERFPTAQTELHVQLGVSEGERRVSVPEPSYVQRMQPGQQYCEERKLIVEEGADVSRPVELRMEVSGGAAAADAVLAARSVTGAELRAPLATGCGADLVCRPALVLTLTPLSPLPFVLGTGRRWSAVLLVRNEGDSAYGARVRLAVRGARVLRVPSACKIAAPGLVADSLDCNIFSPLHHGNETRLPFELDVSELQSGADEVRVSASALDEVSARPVALAVQLLSRATFNLTGWSTPEEARQQPGVAVALLHHFQVVNEGPTQWRRVEIRMRLANTVRLLRGPCDGSSADESNGADDGANELTERTIKVVDGAFNCFVNNMSAGARVDFTLALETNHQDLDKLFDNDERLEIVTVAEVTPEGGNITRGETVTVVLRAERMAWWIPLTALLAALLLLALLVYALRRAGFFKRRERDQLRLLRDQDPPPTNDEMDECEDIPLGTH